MGMEMTGSSMTSGGMTPAEAILLSDHKNNGGYGDGMFGGNGSWVFFLFFLLAWGGNGLGFGGNGGERMATSADLQRGFDNQTNINKLDNLGNGICDGFYAMNTGILNGFHGVDAALCSGFNAINQNINQARFEAQNCCCETNRNIDAIRSEAYKNTCEITTALHAEGEATRQMMQQTEMQRIRDENMYLRLDKSQCDQNAYLVHQLKDPCPIPAYVVPNPYCPCPCPA